MKQVFQPQLQIRNSCLIHYYLPMVQPPRNRHLSLNKAYSGKVTGAAKKRIRKAIDILIQQTPWRTTYNPVTKKLFPFQLNFVTLTIANKKNLDAKSSYQLLLKPFIRKIRKFGNLSYVWKCELQKRGQIHYHFVTDTFMPWQSIRSTWNNLQRKNRLLDDYARKHKHFDPNSTDIHALDGIGDIEAYIAKYFGKDNQASINGKTWDCSNDLKRNRFAFTPTYEQDMLLRELRDDKKIEVIELDRCTIFKGVNTSNFLESWQSQAYVNWKS